MKEEEKPKEELERGNTENRMETDREKKKETEK